MQKFYQTLSADACIVGGGLAAIKAAYDCAEAGLSVVMIVKRELCSGSSFYPLTSGLGSQAPCSEEDKQWFMEELQQSGAGMQDDHLTKIYIDEINDRIPELPKLGIEYVTPPGRKACFAKRDRVLACWYGLDKLKSPMSKIITALPGMTVLEFTDAVTLVKDGERVAGVVAADYRNRLIYVKATSVLLATGGYAGLYKHSLNTDDVCGLGQALAAKAGAELVNMEFTQFIPGVLSPVYKMLFSEMTLAFCDGVFNREGEDILQKYLPAGASERECLDSRGGHGPFTCEDISKYFDICMMSEILRTGDERGFRLLYRKEMLESDNFFVKMYNSLAAKNNVDLASESLWIAPFGHCANGGVLIDENAATTVPGLYAAGEVAGGLHGADRHGGNASGCCQVFGHRAALSMIARKTATVNAPDESEAMQQYLASLNSGKSGCILPEEALKIVRDDLWKKCSIVRDGKHLAEALADVAALKADFNPAMLVRAGTAINQAMGAYHCLTTAEALLMAADGRKESRGSHYRSDFPVRDEENFLKRQFLSIKDGEMVRRFR